MITHSTECEPWALTRITTLKGGSLWLTPHIPIEEEITSMLDERDDVANNEPIEEIDNVQIGEEVIDKVRYKDVESALVTLK